MKVAIQGILGSFHDQAAHKILPNENIELVQCRSFGDLFTCVKEKSADSGVVAIENNLHGSINAVYRELSRANLWMCGEVFLKIEQCLIGTSESSLPTIKEVLSQAPALAQCEQWLDSNLPNAIREETHDTAESVRDIVLEGNSAKAAIGSRKAHEIYGGKILAGPINDDPHNYTRFVLLSSDRSVKKNANKTSVILKTGHEPGALYRALGVFSEAEVNLSKLDSHPIAGDKWHYAFYLDFDQNIDDPISKKILTDLKNQDCQIQVLGSYPSGNMPL